MTYEGIHAGIPFKAGSIGRDVGYDALQRYYRKSEEEISQSGRLEGLRKTVSDAGVPRQQNDLSALLGGFGLRRNAPYSAGRKFSRFGQTKTPRPCTVE